VPSALHHGGDQRVEAGRQFVVGDEAHPGLQQGADLDHRERVEQLVARALAEGLAEPAEHVQADHRAQPLDVGVGAEQRVVGRRGQVRASRQDRRELPGHRLDPLQRRLSGDLGGVLEQHFAPEQLGEQVVAGGEVGVRRCRAHSGPSGDRAHGDRLRPDGPELLRGGGQQLLHGLGLPGVQLLSRQGGHMTGHVSRLGVRRCRAQARPRRR
jgi:hypothetical protein